MFICKINFKDLIIRHIVLIYLFLFVGISDIISQPSGGPYGPQRLDYRIPETKADILDYAINNLAKYKVPKVIEIVEEMPLTAVGKVDKKVLRTL